VNRGRYEEPRLCIIATPNEAIALNVAIARHLNCFAQEENWETNQLLLTFQNRLTQHLDALSIPPIKRRSQG
jgi:hypothetical protein